VGGHGAPPSVPANPSAHTGVCGWAGQAGSDRHGVPAGDVGFVFLGGYWASRCAVSWGRHPGWGLGFILTPAVVVSADRMTVDGALAALVCGWALYWGERAAPKVVGMRYCGPAASERDGSAAEPGQRDGAGAGPQGAGLALWRWQSCLCRLVRVRATRTQGREGSGAVRSAPAPGGIRRTDAASLRVYAPGTPLRGLLAGLDYVALGGIALALVLGIRQWLRRRDGAIEIAMLLFLPGWRLRPGAGCLGGGFCVGRWVVAVAAVAGAEGIGYGEGLLGLPMALVTLRVGAQFGSQALGVLRGCSPPFSHAVYCDA